MSGRRKKEEAIKAIKARASPIKNVFTVWAVAI